MIEFVFGLHNFLLLSLGLNVEPKTAQVVFPSRVSVILSKAGAHLKRVRRDKLLRRTRFNADCYSMRVPTPVAQPVPIKLSFASKISTAALVVKPLPLPLSFKAAVTFCELMKTPLAS